MEIVHCLSCLCTSILDGQGRVRPDQGLGSKGDCMTRAHLQPSNLLQTEAPQHEAHPDKKVSRSRRAETMIVWFWRGTESIRRTGATSARRTASARRAAPNTAKSGPRVNYPIPLHTETLEDTGLHSPREAMPLELQDRDLRKQSPRTQ